MHRVRPLPGRLPGLGDGQAAQPQDDDHGPARDVGRRGAWRRVAAVDPLHPRLRRAGTSGAPSHDALGRAIVDTAIPYDAVWDCVTCGACVEACPVLIEHVDKIVGLRRNLVLEELRFPAELAAAFTNMERHGNPWGQPPAPGWTGRGACPSTVPTAAQVVDDGGPDAVAELECLYWVGCAASFDDRNRKVARAFVTCLDAAGVDFAVLGQEESCSGDPARRMGNEYVYPDPGAGQRRDARALPAQDDRHGLPALLQHDRQRVRPVRRPLRRRPPLDRTWLGSSGTAV